MHVLRPEEERPEELQHHVVELDVVADHGEEFLHHLPLAPLAWGGGEELGRGGGVPE